MAAADRSTVQQPPDSRDALAARVDRLERALDESKSQLLTLKSETATLVRTVADIRAARSRASVPPSPRSLARIAAAAVGLAIGITLGVAGWLYLDGDEDVSIASPSAAVSEPGNTEGLAPNVASPPSYAAGLAPNVASPPSYALGLAPNVAAVPARYERGQPPDVTSAPGYAEGVAPNVASVPAGYTRGQPADVAGASGRARERYVGTLSIDAEPGGEVFIDRKSAGQTPVRISNLRAGSHLVWIQRDGYRRFTRVVQVPADRVTRVSAELEPVAK